MTDKYIKNGIIAGNTIIVDNQQIINPTVSQLLNAGYEKVITPEQEMLCQAESPSNDQIKAEREKQYKLRSDSYFIAYQKYLLFEELEKAEQAKNLWIAEIEKINNEYPYGTN